MTTTLGRPLVGITMTKPCDAGQCGGEVTVTTDVVHSAYSMTETFGDTDYIGMETEAVVVETDGSIVVHCASINRGDDRCGGTATFTRVDIQTATWIALSGVLVGAMGPMDRA